MVFFRAAAVFFAPRRAVDLRADFLAVAFFLVVFFLAMAMRWSPAQDDGGRPIPRWIGGTAEARDASTPHRHGLGEARDVEHAPGLRALDH